LRHGGSLINTLLQSYCKCASERIVKISSDRVLNLAYILLYYSAGTTECKIYKILSIAESVQSCVNILMSTVYEGWQWQSTKLYNYRSPWWSSAVNKLGHLLSSTWNIVALGWPHLWWRKSQKGKCRICCKFTRIFKEIRTPHPHCTMQDMQF